MGIHEAIKQKKFKNGHEKAFINIMYTANWLDSKYREVFKSIGITQQQYNVLRILKGSHPKPLAAMDIKSRMLDRSPDLTRLIDRLIQKGLVNRRTCPDNRRQIEIGIEDKGINLIQDTLPTLNKGMEAFMKMDEAEANQLSDLLDKFRDDF